VTHGACPDLAHCRTTAVLSVAILQPLYDMLGASGLQPLLLGCEVSTTVTEPLKPQPQASCKSVITEDGRLEEKHATFAD
jgi:hypothetical protein